MQTCRTLYKDFSRALCHQTLRIRSRWTANHDFCSPLKLATKIPKEFVTNKQGSVVIDGLKCSRFVFIFICEYGGIRSNLLFFYLSPKNHCIHIWMSRNCVHFGKLIRVSTVPKIPLTIHLFFISAHLLE